MSLNNQEIDSLVRTIASACVRDLKIRPQDKPLLEAITTLSVNLLQNINDIAYAISDLNERRP